MLRGVAWSAHSDVGGSSPSFPALPSPNARGDRRNRAIPEASSVPSASVGADGVDWGFAEGLLLTGSQQDVTVLLLATGAPSGPSWAIKPNEAPGC